MTEYLKQYSMRYPQLGRHVRHDPRSLLYQVKAQDISTLVSVVHHSNIGVLNQGQLGSCTGNAATKCVSYDQYWADTRTWFGTSDPDAVELLAIGIYSAATKLDPWEGTYPPTDTGSDGLSVAKVLTQEKLISGYKHATSLEAALTALSKVPVIVGTEWREDMFSPHSDGRLLITGGVAGGHEYCLDELDVENKRVWLQNSWGESWGHNGRAYLTWDDLDTLLQAKGDCTAFVPSSQPAPKPDPKAEFLLAAQKWTARNHPCNKGFQNALDKFLAWYA